MDKLLVVHFTIANKITGLTAILGFKEKVGKRNLNEILKGKKKFERGRHTNILEPKGISLIDWLL